MAKNFIELSTVTKCTVCLDLVFAVGGPGTFEKNNYSWPIVGLSHYYNHNNAEIYNASSLSWKVRPSYPYAPSITNYAIQAVGNQFIIFGGVNFKHFSWQSSRNFNSDCISSTIASYNPFENEWKNLGKLKTPRYGHSVALVNNQFIVIGGVYSPGKGHFAETYLFNEDRITFSVETEIPLNLGADLEVIVSPGLSSLYTDQHYCNFV